MKHVAKSIGVLVVLAAFLGIAAPSAHGQGVSAVLQISAQVESSISLVFNSTGTATDCPLSNSGTAHVGLYFGQVSWGDGTGLVCGRYARPNGTYFTLDSSYWVKVQRYNSSSPNFDLTVWLSPTTNTGIEYRIVSGATTLLDGTPRLIENNVSYAAPAATGILHTLNIRVQKNGATTGPINQQINYQATAQ